MRSVADVDPRSVYELVAAGAIPPLAAYLQSDAVMNVNAMHPEQKRTLLHVAAASGQFEACSLLCSCGADPNIFNEQGLTPLHEAANTGSAQCISMLIHAGAGVNTVSSSTVAMTGLHFAAYAGHVDACRVLLDKGADASILSSDGFSPLHGALQRNRLDVCRYLLERGCTVNTANKEGRTPLHLAVEKNSPLVQDIIDAHCDLNCVEKIHGWTALHVAAHNGQLVCVKMLLAAGAMAALRDLEGRLAYDLAVAEGFNTTAAALRSSSEEL